MSREVASEDTPIGKRSIVIGGGISGLSAAGVLAKFFEEVVILEKDELSEESAPRPGVPHGKQPHGILGGAVNALNVLFPGFERDLIQVGAMPIDPGFDMLHEIPGHDPFPRQHFGRLIYGLSRPLIELTIRRRVERLSNVVIRAGCRVLELAGSPDGAVVTGVRYTTTGESVEELFADLVIDASSLGSLTQDFLESSGQAQPKVTTIGVDVRQSVASFSIPKRNPDDFKVVMTRARAPESSRSANLFPLENGGWQVLLVGRGIEAPPGDAAGFMNYLRRLETPTIYNAVKDAPLVGEIRRFAFPESVWRHFGLLEDFPRGLLPIGDAICRLNPAYGQGMTVAFQEAVLLHHILEKQASEADPLATLGKKFLYEVESLVADPWAISTIPDFIYSQTRGERPPNLASSLQFEKTLYRISARDPATYRMIIDVQHLLKPLCALWTPEMLRRVEAEMAA